ncbi:uncharacterized protein LOC125893276 isoform X2 [Epinephelus fuscoguttatus]|uniref:uncharacterized protein LOC125893276 isoform X2 n=1 Tax=Epinephelus fuscoguttatus TaxID=293821 RepID=UPI0020D19148|nr:uncharacterized protein LOC125893276 isoform X2 [Epinephelus fuscoguttatus]
MALADTLTARRLFKLHGRRAFNTRGHSGIASITVTLTPAERCHLPCAPRSVSVCDRTRLVTAHPRGILTTGPDTASCSAGGRCHGDVGSARPCSSVFRDDLARMTSAFIYRCPGQRVLAVLVDPTNTSLGDHTPLHVLPAMSASPYPFRWGMCCALFVGSVPFLWQLLQVSSSTCRRATVLCHPGPNWPSAWV